MPAAAERPLRILQITAGAAGMYCGSCFRDNALAAELISGGHQVTLLPVYTPTLTDEANVSQERVFFGGISVYLEQYIPLFRYTPRLLDRLWDSRLMLRLASGRSVQNNPKLLGEMTVSMLRGTQGFQRKEIDKLLRWLGGQPAPDVVNLPNSLLLGLAAPLRQALRRPVCCTLQGEDLFLRGLREPYQSRALELIRAQVAHVDVFLAVSEFCATSMADFLHIPPDRIRVVPLGINLAGYGRARSSKSRPWTIGYLARITPEKGLHLLADAYRLLRAADPPTPMRLEAAGYLAPENRPYLQRIEREFLAAGRGGEFRYRGAPDRAEKIAFLQELDVLSVPATYDEPKGLFLLEAMACGVPVVQPRRGSFPEILERTGGGLLVAPDNARALADGLRTLQQDRDLAHRLAAAGEDGVRRHYSASQMAQRAVDVYRELLEGASLSHAGAGG